MTWLMSAAFVNSLSSQEQAAASSEENFSDGEPSALLNGSHTQLAYLPPDKMTAFSRLSRFGMTFKPLTAGRGEELLMLYREAFLAKTFPLLGAVPVLTVNGQECGNTWRGWSAKYDPDSFTWRTAQCSLLEDSNESLATLPRSGMTRNGLLWELPMLERRTKGTESGSWPTPQASDNRPRATINSTARRIKLGKQVSLEAAVKFWPTPTAHNSKEGAYPAEYTRKTPTLAAQAGGSLNPTWVEWLMNWPMGWTLLERINEQQTKFWKESSTAALQGDSVRAVWFNNDPSQAPQGSQPVEQPDGKRGDSLRDLSQQGSPQAFSNALQSVRKPVSAEQKQAGNVVQSGLSFNLGASCGSETLVPRVARNVTARVDRLKAIGNGQVPLCAAEAWRYLTS